MARTCREALSDLLVKQEAVQRQLQAEGRAEEYFNTLLDVIHDLAPRRNALSDVEVRVVFSAIYILEKNKRIPSDEYNGCIFGYSI